MKKTKADETKHLPLAGSADDLFNADDRPEQIIDLPEKGFSIIVREPDAKTTSLIHQSVTDEKGNHDDFEFRVRWMFESMVKPKPRPEHINMIKSLGSTTFNTWLYSIGKKKEA